MDIMLHMFVIEHFYTMTIKWCKKFDTRNYLTRVAGVVTTLNIIRLINEV